MKLSLIIPAYNEEKRNLIPTLNEYHKGLTKEFGTDFELIIIPNNCTDNTEGVVRDWIKDNHPRAWSHVIKGGKSGKTKGSVVMKGFDMAQGDWIGFVDADNATTVKEFLKCYRGIGYKKGLIPNDGVIASRRKIGAKISPPRRWTQSLSSWLFNFVVNLLFGLGIWDTQCGCKLFSKRCAKFLVKNHTETGWNFDVDLLYLCQVYGFKIREHPINWTDFPGGQVSTLDGIKAVLLLFKYRIKKWKDLFLNRL